jgi:tetratricopeptide (TPR) repeat protein
MWSRQRVLALVAVAAVMAGACAKKVAPPAVPTPARYPDFIFPTVPAALQRTPGADRVELGWRYLQAGQPAQADAVFLEIVTRRPELYPARAGQGYVALARRDPGRALVAFDAALTGASTYTPALIGRGQALLALGREDDALGAFEAAQAVDSRLNLRDRIELLRLRRVQGLVEGARATARTGTPEQARAAYEAAIAASPESGFLYRELGQLELRQGRPGPALERLRHAVALAPTDAASWVEIGDILLARGERQQAEEAYRAAYDADPSLDLASRLGAVTEPVRTTPISPELAAIPGTEQITRGDLAALVADRLGYLLALAPARQEVVTDIRGHWASDAIARVVRAGVVEAFSNHTFQPRQRLRRSELASAVSRLLALLPQANRPAAERTAARPVIADMAPTHLDYPAASRAMAAGVMALVDGRFLPGRAVSGREAGETLERVHQLAERAGIRP